MSYSNLKSIVLITGVVTMLGCVPPQNENGYSSGPSLRLEEAKVNGLGVVKVGDVLLHKKFGAGRVVSLEAGFTTIAEINFSGQTKFLVLEKSPITLQNE